MGIPEHMLPHAVTFVRPSTSTDSYGNTTRSYAGSATRTVAQAWLQQDNRSEARTDGRDAAVQNWLVVTNYTDVLVYDRVDFGGQTFEVEGPPEAVYTPAGFHHTEATLKVVSG